MDTTEEKKSKGGGSRNNEKRRERSKVAARCRRGKEAEIFSDLASCLPLPETVRNTLDKASVARLAVTNLKLKGMMSEVFAEIENGSKNKEYDSLLNQAMGGFLFVLSTDGDLVFASESLTKCLGLSQYEVMGQSIYDFSHPCDHQDIKNLLTINKQIQRNVPIHRSGFFRMKCTITSKGRSVHLRAASYKGISCRGRLYFDEKDPSLSWYVGVGEPLSDPTDVNFPLNKQAFITRHSMDMKCDNVAGKIENFMGYNCEDLIGKSFYDFYHASDGESLGKSIKALYLKGQIQTERYRFLAKNGGWVWCITQATVLKPENGTLPSGVICLHFVTSGIENEHEILSDVQLKASGICLIDSSAVDAEAVRLEKYRIVDAENVLPNILTGAGISHPTPCTTKIFAPRTADMDSGFLMPVDSTLNVCKGEPEDLTHLAPIPGDDCVSLNVPLLDDLLRSFDQANFEYSMNGFFVDVDSIDNIPLFDIEDIAQLREESHQITMIPDSVQISDEKGIESMSSSACSPLFLHSDPHMGLNSNFTLCPSPLTFQGTDGEKRLKKDEIENFTSGLGEFGLNLTSYFKIESKEALLAEEMSEFRAPYIPTNESEDIELMYSATEFLFQTEDTLITGRANESIQSAETLKSSQPQTSTNSVPVKKKSKFYERNISEITWTLDIASILAARKPNDQPKIVTRSVFGTLDPPPKKLRKMAIVPATRRTQNSDPFLNSISNVKVERIDTLSSPDLKMKQQALDYRISGNSDSGRIQTSCILPTNFLRKRTLSSSLLSEYVCAPSFYELTQQDFEGIVPVVNTTLLQGTELFQALESISENSSDFNLNACI